MDAQTLTEGKELKKVGGWLACGTDLADTLIVTTLLAAYPLAKPSQMRKEGDVENRMDNPGMPQRKNLEDELGQPCKYKSCDYLVLIVSLPY